MSDTTTPQVTDKDRERAKALCLESGAHHYEPFDLFFHCGNCERTASELAEAREEGRLEERERINMDMSEAAERREMDE
jgi:hypothetical protein